MQTAVRVVTMPSEDHDFADRVRASVRKMNGEGSSDEALIAFLERELAPLYPGLTVRQQHGLASLGESEVTWYVYRDGNRLSL